MAEDIDLNFESCWFDAPPERSQDYFPVYSRVSKSTQATMRQLVAERLFSNLEHFRDTRKAYPALLYIASRPFPGQPKTEFAYDVLNRTLMRKFYYSVGQNLPRILELVSQRLREADMADLAKHYRPHRAAEVISTVVNLRMCRRRLEVLLVSEAVMITSLLSFAGSGRLPEKTRQKIAAGCRRVWRSRLFRVLSDWKNRSPEVLAAATQALKLHSNGAVEAA